MVKSTAVLSGALGPLFQHLHGGSPSSVTPVPGLQGPPSDLQGHCRYKEGLYKREQVPEEARGGISLEVESQAVVSCLTGAGN